MAGFDWIINESNLPWLELDITFPMKKMYTEAVNLRDRFVPHRDEDQGAYRHKGWHSLCIHGISAEKTIHLNNMDINLTKKPLTIGLI